jgi:hypothetical protein
LISASGDGCWLVACQLNFGWSRIESRQVKSTSFQNQGLMTDGMALLFIPSAPPVEKIGVILTGAEPASVYH